MTSLNMEFSRDGTTVTVKLAGRLDGNSGPEFGRAMADQFAAGVVDVVLDLHGVEFVSSAGLRELMMLAKKLNQTKTKARLVGVQPPVNEVLEISGMGSLFERAESGSAGATAQGERRAGGGLLGRFFSGGAKA